MPWVNDLRKLSEAVPPAYARFLGEQARQILEANDEVSHRDRERQPDTNQPSDQP